jgi:hypothetical protein
MITELVEFLERRACTVARSGRAFVDVQLADDLGEERTRRELDLYLSVFRSTHPAADLEVVGPGNGYNERAAARSSSRSGTSSVP